VDEMFGKDAFVYDIFVPTNVVMEAFEKDAFDTFINVPVGIEKFPVTERFTKLIFVLVFPYGKPFTVVTDIFVNDALP